MWAFKLTCILLAASHVHSAAIGPHDIHKRETYVVKENVLVTEQLAVVKQLDGTEVIGQAIPVATAHSLSDPVLVPEDDKASTPPNLELQIAGTTEDPIQPAHYSDMTPQSTPNFSNSQPESNIEQSGSDTSVSEAENSTSDVSTKINNVPTTGSTIANTEESPVPVKQQGQVSDVITEGEPQGHSKAAASRMAKRGIAYNDVSKLSVFTTSSKVSWAYNWGSSTPPIANNVEYVPMLWGTGSHAEGWTENANKALASGSTHLLAFNEPDLGAQSSLGVGEAVSGYRQLMQPFAGKARLGSPAVTNGGAPMGLSYLQSFIMACSGCTIDFVAIHWYNGGNAADFKNYVTKAHEVSGGRPVWITEFEGPGDAGQQKAFLAEVLPWLDSQDFVERYAYFMASDGNMISSGLTPSAVGEAFAFSN